MPTRESATQLYAAVCRIPRGRVVSYGAMGELLTPPISGRMVGRLMFQCPEDVPWWRVVNRLGALPIGKRSPQYAIEQRQRLEKEGVQFCGDCVDMTQFSLSVEQMEVLLGMPARRE